MYDDHTSPSAMPASCALIICCWLCVGVSSFSNTCTCIYTQPTNLLQCQTNANSNKIISAYLFHRQYWIWRYAPSSELKTSKTSKTSKTKNLLTNFIAKKNKEAPRSPNAFEIEVDLEVPTVSHIFTEFFHIRNAPLTNFQYIVIVWNSRHPYTSVMLLLVGKTPLSVFSDQYA